MRQTNVGAPSSYAVVRADLSAAFPFNHLRKFAFELFLERAGKSTQTLFQMLQKESHARDDHKMKQWLEVINPSIQRVMDTAVGEDKYEKKTEQETKIVASADSGRGQRYEKLRQRIRDTTACDLEVFVAVLGPDHLYWYVNDDGELLKRLSECPAVDSVTCPTVAFFARSFPLSDTVTPERGGDLVCLSIRMNGEIWLNSNCLVSSEARRRQHAYQVLMVHVLSVVPSQGLDATVSFCYRAFNTLTADDLELDLEESKETGDSVSKRFTAPITPEWLNNALRCCRGALVLHATVRQSEKMPVPLSQRIPASGTSFAVVHSSPEVRICVSYICPKEDRPRLFMVFVDRDIPVVDQIRELTLRCRSIMSSFRLFIGEDVTKAGPRRLVNVKSFRHHIRKIAFNTGMDIMMHIIAINDDETSETKTLETVQNTESKVALRLRDTGAVLEIQRTFDLPTVLKSIAAVGHSTQEFVDLAPLHMCVQVRSLDSDVLDELVWRKVLELSVPGSQAVDVAVSTKAVFVCIRYQDRFLSDDSRACLRVKAGQVNVLRVKCNATTKDVANAYANASGASNVHLQVALVLRTSCAPLQSQSLFSVLHLGDNFIFGLVSPTHVYEVSALFFEADERCELNADLMASLSWGDARPILKPFATAVTFAPEADAKTEVKQRVSKEELELASDKPVRQLFVRRSDVEEQSDKQEEQQQQDPHQPDKQQQHISEKCAKLENDYAILNAKIEALTEEHVDAKRRLDEMEKLRAEGDVKLKAEVNKRKRLERRLIKAKDEGYSARAELLEWQTESHEADKRTEIERSKTQAIQLELDHVKREFSVAEAEHKWLIKELSSVDVKSRAECEDQRLRADRLDDELSRERLVNVKMQHLLGNRLNEIKETAELDRLLQELAVGTAAIQEEKINRRVKKVPVCPICMERHCDCAPQCGHMLCRKCAEKLAICPTCRARIVQLITMHSPE
jgi:hypothetical protein